MPKTQISTIGAGIDTIFALATPAGRGGIAVIRVSGPAATAAIIELCPAAASFPARRACLASLRSPDGGEVLDEALVLIFPAPRSFTGEDVVELHLHGGPAVVGGVIDALSRRTGLRPAAAGEFTRRAFLAGKLDLTQAEGLADLVAAETAAQRRQALRQFGGALGGLYESWRAGLIALLARVEAAIDFPDEDLPTDLAAGVRKEIKALRRDMSAHLHDGGRGERLRDGIYVAIIGPPNAGKSSLLNRLAQRDVAIVSETAGTTRDVIEVHLELAGLPVILADTAGLREAGDAVEQEGVRRALARAETADLKVLVGDATNAAASAAFAGLADERAIVVSNKIDLMPEAAVAGLPISAKTGQGMEALLGRLRAEATERLATAEAPALTRARHRQAVEACTAALARAEQAEDVVLLAEDMRLAARCLGRITGRVDVEDILDVVFSEFCIGK